MKKKILLGLLAGATIGTAITVPALGAPNTHSTNTTLLSNRTTSSKTNEAVVTGGNLYALSNGKGIVSNLSSGEMLTMLKQSENGYCKVRVQETGAVGYINTNNMQNILNATNDNSTPLSQNGQVINVSTALNFRTAPSINASIINHLSNGTSVKILAKQGQWYKISYNGQTGFVYGYYLNSGAIVQSTMNAKGSKSSDNANSNTIKTRTRTTVNKVVYNSGKTLSKGGTTPKNKTEYAPGSGAHVNNMSNGSTTPQGKTEYAPGPGAHVNNMNDKNKTKINPNNKIVVTSPQEAMALVAKEIGTTGKNGKIDWGYMSNGQDPLFVGANGVKFYFIRGDYVSFIKHREEVHGCGSYDGLDYYVLQNGQVISRSSNAGQNILA